MCEAIQFGSVEEILHVSSNKQIWDAHEDQNACIDRSPDQESQSQQEQRICEDQAHQYLGKQEHHLDIVLMGDQEQNAVDDSKLTPEINLDQGLYNKKESREWEEDDIEEEDGSHNVPEDEFWTGQECKSYDEKSEYREHSHEEEKDGSVINQEKGEKDIQPKNIKESWKNSKEVEEDHIKLYVEENIKNQLGGIDSEYKSIYFSTQHEDGESNQDPQELNIHRFRSTKRNIKTRNIRNAQKGFSFESYNLYSILDVENDKEDETDVQIESIFHPPKKSKMKRKKSKPLKERGKYPKKNENTIVESREKEQKRLNEVLFHPVIKILTRCKKCFTNHTPSLPKFCRWSLSRKNCQENQNEKQINLSKETTRFPDDRISFLQNVDIDRQQNQQEQNESYQKIIENIFKKGCNDPTFPDICFESSNSESVKEELKLCEGARLKIFDTDNEEMCQVLSLLRSLRVFHQFESHEKCKLKPTKLKESLCDFCLIRSLVLKSKSSTGRQLIKPVEFLCSSSINTVLPSTSILLNFILRDMNKSVETFTNSFATKWTCKECKREEVFTKNFIVDLDCESNSQAMHWETYFNHNGAGQTEAYMHLQ